MYTALKTMPLDDALDLMEIDDVARSWRAAVMKNIAWRKGGAPAVMTSSVAASIPSVNQHRRGTG